MGLSSHRYLTIQEAATALRLSETSIQGLLTNGVLHHFRIGRQVRIDPRTIDPKLTPPPPPRTQTLTLRELGARWRVSERTLKRLVDDGGLPALCHRNIVRVSRHVVESLEAGRPEALH